MHTHTRMHTCTCTRACTHAHAHAHAHIPPRASPPTRVCCWLVHAVGVRVVFTSNRPPEQLYERGLNRRYFLPFVGLLREQCRVLRVGAVDAPIDYRQSAPLPAAPASGALGVPLPAASSRALAPRPRGAYWHGPGAAARLWSAWDPPAAQPRSTATAAAPREVDARDGACDAASDGAAAEAAASAWPTRRNLALAYGRALPVRSRGDGACFFNFDELCGRPGALLGWGPADYLALASATPRLYLAEVPVLTSARRNEARRLVALVDALYEARVTLHVSAHAPLNELVAPLLAEAHARSPEIAPGAEVEIRNDGAGGGGDAGGSATFEEAPVGGRYRVDGELASFFTVSRPPPHPLALAQNSTYVHRTNARPLPLRAQIMRQAKDEAFMLRRTASRLTEMCEHSSS